MGTTASSCTVMSASASTQMSTKRENVTANAVHQHTRVTSIAMTTTTGAGVGGMAVTAAAKPGTPSNTSTAITANVWTRSTSSPPAASLNSRAMASATMTTITRTVVGMAATAVQNLHLERHLKKISSNFAPSALKYVLMAKKQLVAKNTKVPRWDSL